MRRSSFLFFLLIVGFLFLGASCVRFVSKSGDGGVFVSLDGGKTWQQRGFIRQEKKKAVTLNGANVLDLVLDPKNPGTLYAALDRGGIYKTINRGEQWQEFLATEEPIIALALNEKDPQTVFAALPQRVIRTLDGGQNWDGVYIETRPNVRIKNLLVDSFDPKRVYLIFSNGQITRSVDSGTSWAQFYETVDRNDLVDVLIHPKDTRVITVATEGKWPFRTTNLGKSWAPLQEALESYNGAHHAQVLATNQNDAQSLFYVSDFGLLKTKDGGKTWSEIKLLLPTREAKVKTFAVNPKKPKELVYTTAQTLYSSPDEGKSWSPRQLPTTRQPTVLLLDPEDQNILYLGVRKAN